MRKISLLVVLITICCFSQCKKNDEEIKGTRDLKNLTLTQLKNFLDGKWRLHHTELYTIVGRRDETIPDSVRVYLIFYPVDSVKRENTVNNIVIREKLEYQYLSLPGTGGGFANVLMFDKDSYGYRNKWVADTLINDTLVFANYFRSEGVNNYYFTKEQ